MHVRQHHAKFAELQLPRVVVCRTTNHTAVLKYNHKIQTQRIGLLSHSACPTECCTLTVVNGLLTAVGGAQPRKYINKVISCVKEGGRRKWVEHFPPMLTERRNPAAVCMQWNISSGGRGAERVAH